MISIARPVLEEVVATKLRLGAVEGPVATTWTLAEQVVAPSILQCLATTASSLRQKSRWTRSYTKVLKRLLRSFLFRWSRWVRWARKSSALCHAVSSQGRRGSRKRTLPGGGWSMVLKNFELSTFCFQVSPVRTPGQQWPSDAASSNPKLDQSQNCF